LATTAAVVGTADASGAGVGTTIVGTVLSSMIGAVKARGLWVHDVLWALRSLIVPHVHSISGKDAATFHPCGLGLTGSGAKAPEDVSGH